MSSPFATQSSPVYDSNGNQQNLTATGESISWTALNQPISMNGVTATYDALGRMVETGSGSSYQQFVFRPSGVLLAIYNAGTSTLVKGTVPLPGGDTAIYNASGLSYLRHTDWLGSSRLATTWAHAVYSKEAYAPFGETYNEAGTADRSFTGQDQDVVTGSGRTGAYDFLFRKHDPSAGRWLSPDPYGWNAVNLGNPQSLNRYSYVQNQPLSAFDPSGLDCVYVSSEGGYYIQGGDCTSDDDDGIYVDGTFSGAQIDPNTGQVTELDFNGPMVYSDVYVYASDDDEIGTLVSVINTQISATPLIGTGGLPQCPATSAQGSVTYKSGKVPPASEPINSFMICESACMGGSPFRATSTSDSHPQWDPHTYGLAVDGTIPGPSSQVLQCGANCGAIYMQNEFVNPSANATAGHYHFQLVPGKGGAAGPVGATCHY